MHAAGPGRSGVAVSAGEKLPVCGVQTTDPGSRHPAHDHVVAAIPKSVVGNRINVVANIPRSCTIAAELNKVRRRETSSWKHGRVVVQLGGTRPRSPVIHALDDAGVLRGLPPARIAAFLPVSMPGDDPIQDSIDAGAPARFPGAPIRASLGFFAVGWHRIHSLATQMERIVSINAVESDVGPGGRVKPSAVIRWGIDL